MARKVLAALLFILATALLVWSVVVLSTVWDDYKDSSDSTYVLNAAVVFGLAVLAAAAGYLTIRQR
ncbi:MAG TPA: hypothetical protein VKA36_09615 [Solirubrobacterales bacterium]|nr:hypothetical protein [Solirubrobacterales bacterium]